MDPNEDIDESLNTIRETERESVSDDASNIKYFPCLTSFCRALQKLDSFALDPEEAQRHFVDFLKERDKEIALVEIQVKM